MKPSLDLMEHEEYQYLRLILQTINYGIVRPDQTGTRSIFGAAMRFNLRTDVLPLLTRIIMVCERMYR